MTVVGVDLSTHALDLVKLDDETNRAEWVRCELVGKDAWERTLNVRDSLRGYRQTGETVANAAWFEDVHLCAIEAPYGRGQAGTNALLNRVVGAVCASLPAHLRDPARCWLVAPHEWKAGLGLKGKPEYGDLPHEALIVGPPHMDDAAWQNARDAYCIALFARSELAKGIVAA